MHRSITPSDLPPRQLYQLLISAVIPRPIAWISTVSRDGIRNLAPFSFFNAVGGVPPVVAVSIGSRGGIAKDTLQNLIDTKECVVHIVKSDHAQQMNISSTDWQPEVDEFTRAALETVPSELVTPPRIATAPVAMEGKLLQVVPVSKTGYTLALIEIVRFHIAENLIRANGTIDPAKLNPVARLGGDEYALLGEFFHMTRPLP